MSRGRYKDAPAPVFFESMAKLLRRRQGLRGVTHPYRLIYRRRGNVLIIVIREKKA